MLILLAFYFGIGTALVWAAWEDADPDERAEILRTPIISVIAAVVFVVIWPGALLQKDPEE